MFGPREQLLTSEDPVVSQFLNGRRQGPIGMSEEKDADEQAAEKAGTKAEPALPTMQAQLTPTNGNERAAVARRKERVMGMMHELTPAAQTAVRATFGENGGHANGRDANGRDGGRADDPRYTTGRPR